MVYLAEYNTRSVLREKVYHSKIADVDELKTIVREYVFLRFFENPKKT